MLKSLDVVRFRACCTIRQYCKRLVSISYSVEMLSEKSLITDAFNTVYQSSLSHVVRIQAGAGDKSKFRVSFFIVIVTVLAYSWCHCYNRLWRWWHWWHTVQSRAAQSRERERPHLTRTFSLLTDYPKSATIIIFFCGGLWGENTIIHLRLGLYRIFTQ